MRLCRALDGGGPQPFQLWIGRICEEFPCYGPEEAYRAWLRAPVGLFEEVIEARHFAAMKHRVDTAKTKEDVPDHPLARTVLEIEEAVALEEIADDAAPVHD